MARWRHFLGFGALWVRIFCYNITALTDLVRLVNAMYAYGGIELVGFFIYATQAFLDINVDRNSCRRSRESETEYTPRYACYGISMPPC